MSEGIIKTPPSRAGQLGLLLWKNWLLQKQKKKLTVFEIGLPVLFAVLLFLIRRQMEPDRVEQSTHWDAFSVEKLPTVLDFWTLQAGKTNPELWYTPDNPAVQRVMSRVANRLDVTTDGKGYANEEDLLDALTKEDNRASVLGAVVFGSFQSEDELPAKVSYKIRLHSDSEQHGYLDWKTGLTVPEVTSAVPRENYSDYGGEPGYYKEGFLALQRAVDLAIILEHNSSAQVDDLAVLMKRHPYPPYVGDPFLGIIKTLLPLIVMLSFMVLAPSISKEIVLEKENKLKEFMKMVGLTNWQHWLAWFIKYFIFVFISVVFYTMFLFLGAGDSAPSNSDASLVFVFLLLYCVATILFCFAVAAFFSKASTASNACGILFFVNYAPYFFVGSRYYSMGTWSKVAVSLLHNVAMAFGCRHLATNEGRGAGLKWSNLNTPIIPSDGFTMAHVLLMLLVDCVLYGVFAWYVDAVKPGAYGQPQPYTFPCMPSYWFGGSSSAPKKSKRDEEAGDTIDHGERAHLFEPNPSNEKAGIKIRNLKKVFKKDGKETAAVDGLSLDMMEGQITALLGHNGAGKTTTMFMMTGAQHAYY